MRIATGNRMPPTVDAGGMDIVDLPHVRAIDASFTNLVDKSGAPIDAAWRDRRASRLMEVFRDFDPDILLTETYPFGRRQFIFELNPLLDFARNQNPAPLIAASVRDILVRKDKLSKERWMADQARACYDLVLVHADPNFVRLEDSFPFAGDLNQILHYTGYIYENKRVRLLDNSGDDEVIVSCGGGAVGQKLLDEALQARAMSKRAGDTVWRLLVGHDHDDTTVARLAALAPDGVIVERARRDFPALLKRCRCSVSQAGYNTVMDLLVAGCRSVFVPFQEQGQTEQLQRARLLEQRGFAVVVEEPDLTAARLAAAVDQALAAERTDIAVRIDGAETSGELLLDSARRKAASQ